LKSWIPDYTFGNDIPKNSFTCGSLPVYPQSSLQQAKELTMAHAYTAIMNGRDICRFLDIPENLRDRKILITIEPVEVPVSDRLLTLFANAPTIRIPKDIAIDALTEEMNDALS
jgi:hypothetical protein